MLIWQASNFFGANQQAHPKRLAEGMGVNVENLRLGFADLRPLNAPATVVTTGGLTPLISAYRANRTVVSDTDYWWQWTTDVDVVRTLIGNDTSEEVFYTGDGAPKSTDTAIGLPAGPGPASARTMGIPKPGTQMGVPVVATPGTGTTQRRVYLDTFINDRNRESAPGIARSFDCLGGSTVNLSGLSSIPGGNHGIDRRRIYVSVDGSDYQLVVEQGATLTTAFDDGVTRGAVLQSGGDDTKPAWLEPPSTLKGLLNLYNSMFGGFTGKTFAVCVPGKPWAWPLEYQDTLPDDIVGSASWGQNWMLCTTAHPWIVRGGPLLFDKQPSRLKQACRSKRSVVGMGHGACWDGPNGLCYDGEGPARIVTEGILSPEQWRALVPAGSLIGSRFERWYVGFFNDGTARGFMVDPLNPQGIIFLTFGARGVYYDQISDRLYLQDTGNVIKRWGHGGALTVRFKSPVVRHPYLTNPGFALLIADEPISVAWKLWAFIRQADGTTSWVLVDDRTITAGDAFSLPSGYVAQDFQIEVATTGALQGLQLAEAPEDFV